jgi:hypothetical protein
MAMTTDRKTEASKLREMGGGGLPSAALDLFHDREVRHRQVKSDSRFRDEHKAEQLGVIDDEIAQRLFDANDRDVAAAMKPLQDERAKLLGEIKGTNQPPSEFLTSDERHERSARAMREAVTLNSDLVVASATDDAGDLLDTLDTVILSEHEARIRRLGPVVVARLAALIRQSGGSVNASADLTQAYTRARATFDAWKRQHPTPIARLRQIDKDLPAVRQPIDRAYVRSKEHFKLGRWAQGMTL